MILVDMAYGIIELTISLSGQRILGAAETWHQKPEGHQVKPIDAKAS
jgi:hypothetical protein